MQETFSEERHAVGCGLPVGGLWRARAKGGEGGSVVVVVVAVIVLVV